MKTKIFISTTLGGIFLIYLIFNQYSSVDQENISLSQNSLTQEAVSPSKSTHIPVEPSNNIQKIEVISDVEKDQYDLSELNTLVTNKSNFSMNSMLALSSLYKFNEALYQVADKTSYSPQLAEITAQHKNYFDSLPEVLNGDFYVENIACDTTFCLASFQVSENYKWDDSLMQTDEIPIYTTYLKQVKGEGFTHQILIYSIDKRIQGVESS